MRSHRKELWFEIPGRRAFVNITREVERAVIVTIVCDRGDRYLSTGVFPE